MLSQRMWRALAVGGSVFTGAMLLGITGAFDLSADTNLFSTGITPGLVMGLWMLALGWAIYKHRV